jgi:hypothetical protein
MALAELPYDTPDGSCVPPVVVAQITSNPEVRS